MDNKRKRVIPAAQAKNREKYEANHLLRMRAYNMHIVGYTYEQIGEEVGRSASTVHGWVSKHMKKLEQDTLETIRQIELARLDKQQVFTDQLVVKALEMAEKADTQQNPDLALKAANVALRAQKQMQEVQESRRKFLGLDAAEKVHIEIDDKTDAEKKLDATLKETEERVRHQEQQLKDALADEQ